MRFGSPEIRTGQENRFANMRGRRWLKHAGGILFAAQVGSQHEPAHAMGHHVYRLYRLAAGIFQTRQEGGETPARSSMVADEGKLHVLKNRLTSPLLCST